jgi:hypothetical protein
MIQMPYTKICGACCKSKNLEAFNRATVDPRFRKNVCIECENLGHRKFNCPVMTMAVENY